MVINKVDTAERTASRRCGATVRRAEPARQSVVEAASPIFVEEPEAIRGNRVLAVEDGPTLTHGEMEYGAGVLAARKHGAAEVVDPRPYAVGTHPATFAAYPGIGPLLPAMGYGEEQVRDLEATDRAHARRPGAHRDARRPAPRDPDRRSRALRVGYELQEIGRPT